MTARPNRSALLLLAPFALAAGCGAEPAPVHDPVAADVDGLTAEMMESYGIDGAVVVVVNGDDVVVASGYGRTQQGAPFDGETPVVAYSATKALSAFVYASLIEDGAFDVDAPLGSYLEDAPESWRDLPFWRLLNHTSGITTITDRPEFPALDADPRSSNADVYRIVRDLPFDYAPGESSRYRQSGWAVAEMIVENELGRSWPELVEAHLTGPAGARATGHRQMLSGGREIPLLTSAGWYQTTANDMAAIFRALNSGAVVDSGFLEELLYRDVYNFEGYSLGSIQQTVDGIRTVGHRGGGARATIRYAPGAELGVAVFTDQEDNREFAEDLATLLVRRVASDVEARLPVAALLLPLSDRPAGEIVTAYERAAAEAKPRYDFRMAEPTLNRLGYAALREDDVAGAIELLSLNVRAHPNSANAHDSLGEAYLAADRLEDARRSYRRALELSPSSQNPAQMLERIDSLTAAN